MTETYEMSIFGEPWREVTKTEMLVTFAKAGMDVADSLRKLESGERVAVAYVAFRRRAQAESVRGGMNYERK